MRERLSKGAATCSLRMPNTRVLAIAWEAGSETAPKVNDSRFKLGRERQPSTRLTARKRTIKPYGLAHERTSRRQKWGGFIVVRLASVSRGFVPKFTLVERW